MLEECGREPKEHKIKDLDFVTIYILRRMGKDDKRDEDRVMWSGRNKGGGTGGQTRASSAEMLRGNARHPFRAAS